MGYDDNCIVSANTQASLVDLSPFKHAKSINNTPISDVCKVWLMLRSNGLSFLSCPKCP